MTLKVLIIPDVIDRKIHMYFPNFDVEYLTPIPAFVSEEQLDGLYLRQAIEKGNGETFLLIKSSSVTTATPETIERILKSLVGSMQACDLGYLARWGDQCDLQKRIENPSNNLKTRIYELASPRGIQAILLTPCLTAKIYQDNAFDNVEAYLHQQITSGSIRAKGVSPNLFNYDASLDKENTQFYKQTECATGQWQTDSRPQTPMSLQSVPATPRNLPISPVKTDNTWGWASIVVLVLLLVAFGISSRRKI